MNFDKHYSTYEKNSLAQKQVAEHLLSYMKDADILKSDVNSIFEIGCGTGIFTREYRKFFPKSSLILNFVLGVIHALGEVIACVIFYSVTGEDFQKLFYVLFVLVGFGTIVHSMIDYVIALSIFKSIRKIR